jgi:hypothetical protein
MHAQPPLHRRLIDGRLQAGLDTRCRQPHGLTLVSADLEDECACVALREEKFPPLPPEGAMTDPEYSHHEQGYAGNLLALACDVPTSGPSGFRPQVRLLSTTYFEDVSPSSGVCHQESPTCAGQLRVGSTAPKKRCFQYA